MLHSCLSWKRIIFFRVRWMNVLANGSKRKWMFVIISIQCTVIMMGWCIFFDLGTSAQDRSELIAPRFPPIDLMWCLSQPKSVAYAGVVINPLVRGWRILHLRSHKPRTTLWLSWNPSMIVEICWHWTKRSYVICLRKISGVNAIQMIALAAWVFWWNMNWKNGSAFMEWQLQGQKSQRGIFKACSGTIGTNSVLWRNSLGMGVVRNGK